MADWQNFYPYHWDSKANLKFHSSWYKMDKILYGGLTLYKHIFLLTVRGLTSEGSNLIISKLINSYKL